MISVVAGERVHATEMRLSAASKKDDFYRGVHQYIVRFKGRSADNIDQVHGFRLEMASDDSTRDVTTRRAL